MFQDKRMGLAMAGASLIALAACGSGGDDTPDAAPIATPAVLTLSGTAATGAAIDGGVVDVKCKSGAGTATTAANGTYTITISEGGLPCVLKVTKGSTVLHSLVAVPPDGNNAVTAVANITPLTELVVAQVASGSPETFFSAFDAAGQARITPTAVSAAIATAATTLAGAGIDLAGVDPLKDSLVAATPGAAGNALDVLLDRLGDTLAAANTTLVDLGAALVSSGSTGTSAPAQTLLQPVAPGCAALRSGKYRVLNPHETAEDLAYAAHLITVNAPALTVTDDLQAEPKTQLKLDAYADAPCKFTMAGDFGTDTFYVAPSGVMVLLSASAAGPVRTSVVVPEQTVPLAQLAGTWNYIAYEREARGRLLQPSNGTAVVDAAGKFVSGTECAGLVCTPWSAPLPGALTVNATGGFNTTDADGGTSRVFPFVSTSGAISLFVLEPNEGGFSVWTQQAALSLPAVGSASKLWDFTVGSGSFAWTPVNGGSGAVASAVTEATTTVQSVDAATQSITRVRQSDQRVDTVIANNPRNGLRYRAPTSSLSGVVYLPLRDTGLVFYASTEANRNFFGISISQR